MTHHLGLYTPLAFDNDPPNVCPAATETSNSQAALFILGC